MKNTQNFLAGRAGGLKRAMKSPRRSNERKRSLPEGLYGDFGGVNAQEPPPIDTMIMPSFKAVLAPIPEEIEEVCLQRGLMPRTVVGHLAVARFLSFFLLSARTAQECSGVRSSILLADAAYKSGFWADKHLDDSNDIFETGQRFASITDAFGMRACWLKKNRKFRAVMEAMCDPAECLKQLGLCKLWDEMGRRELVSRIADACLQECDTLPHSQV